MGVEQIISWHLRKRSARKALFDRAEATLLAAEKRLQDWSFVLMDDSASDYSRRRGRNVVSYAVRDLTRLRIRTDEAHLPNLSAVLKDAGDSINGILSAPAPMDTPDNRRFLAQLSDDVVIRVSYAGKRSDDLRQAPLPRKPLRFRDKA